jgi:hypothetical protein
VTGKKLKALCTNRGGGGSSRRWNLADTVQSTTYSVSSPPHTLRSKTGWWSGKIKVSLGWPDACLSRRSSLITFGGRRWPPSYTSSRDLQHALSMGRHPMQRGMVRHRSCTTSARFVALHVSRSRTLACESLRIRSARLYPCWLWAGLQGVHMLWSYRSARRGVTRCCLCHTWF